MSAPYPALDDLLGMPRRELRSFLRFCDASAVELQRAEPRTPREHLEHYQAALELERFDRHTRTALALTHHKRRAGSARTEALLSLAFFFLLVLVLSVVPA